MNRSVWLRALAKVAAALVAAVLLCVLTIALVGWNWLRPPLERFVLQKTGRELVIQGNLTAQFTWSAVRLHAATVRFANPAWAQEPQMLAAEGVGIAVDWWQLWQGRVVFPEVDLEQATVFLEQTGDGRKSWLLDLDQRDDSARIEVGRVVLDHGTLGYDDVAQKTSLRAALSTSDSTSGLTFTAQGHYKDLAVKAQGNGGPVLALRDTRQPYPLTLDATAGRTRLRLDGHVTGLLALGAVDMHMKLQGDSLEQLYPLLGIAFPTTRAYTTEGHLLHSGTTWRYEQFSGRVGASDVAGFAQVVTGGPRPVLTADLRSAVLALDDLGPVIGVRPEPSVARANATPAPTPKRVLPELPFHATRWDSVDANVRLQAKTLLRAQALPLENLDVNLKMHDAVLTLDPLNFGLAGGQLRSKITLDGRSNPIKAHAQVHARGVSLAKLFPTIEANHSSVGQVYGDLDLSGTGNSVGGMLATSNGTLGLVVNGGQVSQLMMEKVGLHLWEILGLKLTGDRLVELRCAVADFAVTQGKMQTQALVLDTEVTTVLGTGSIDLAQEQLDLTLNPKTKTTSPLALRSPIYVRGSFAHPTVAVDKGRVALRAAGALALGVINPLLAWVALIDAGPGKDSDCGQLVREANTQQ